jgi:predicted TPR repeat methyltransferase
MEWKLFNGSSEYASKEWYLDREAAAHLEQDTHRERLLVARDLVKKAIGLGARNVVDLGCGDGGLLSLLKEEAIESWGYDLSPSNIEYARAVRKVDARYTDFSNDDDIKYADVIVMTETLEHLEDPHSIIAKLPCKYLIASSPYNENDVSHYEFHLWAWDDEGYRSLLENNGFSVIEQHFVSGWSQIILSEKKL